MSGDSKSCVAYAEEGDEASGSEYVVKPGTRTYARSDAASTAPKERPNTGKSRTDRRRPFRASASSSSEELEESDREDQTQPPPRRHVHIHDQELMDRERRRREMQEQEAGVRTERATKPPPPLKKARPPPLQYSVTQPVVQQGGYRRGQVEDTSFYGPRQPVVAGSRPRASTRPASYYGGQPPHLSMPGMGWAPGHPQPGPGPVHFPLGTVPPPQPMFPGQSPSPRGGPPVSPGYFDPAMALNMAPQLGNRFDPRPQSATGFGSLPMGYPPPSDPRVQPPPTGRRSSSSRIRKETEDRKKMPPPDSIPSRPKSAAPPPSTLFRPQSRHQSSRPPNSHRRSIANPPRGFDDDDRDYSLFHISPQPTREQRREARARTQRALVPQYDNNDSEEEYEEDDDMMYRAAPVDYRRRRSSAYGSRALGSGGVSLENDRLHDAMRYQDEQAGGTKLALTADALRKVNRPPGVPSSRSTRSSASRDDSDYKRSNTTGLTRSSSNNQDEVSINTIKLSGNARVWMGGAEIACDGGEITVTSHPVSARGGSDHTNTTYQIEDNRGRIERKALPHRSRSRAPSQSDSHSRAYLHGHAPYEPAFANPYF